MKRFIVGGTVIGVIVLFILIGILPSLNTIREGELGVVRHWGQATEVLQPGLHMRNWISNDVVIVDTRIQVIEVDFNAHSIDAQMIRGGVTVHYQALPNNAIRVVQEFSNMQGLYAVISPVFLAEAQNVLATKTAMELVENRAILARDIQARLQEIASQYHIVVTNVILEELVFSDEFNRAVENRVRAEQEMMMAEIERERAMIQARQTLEVAEMEKQVVVVQAQAETDALRILQSVWNETAPEMREIMLRQMAIERWNGQLPRVVGGDFSLILDDIMRD